MPRRPPHRRTDAEPYTCRNCKTQFDLSRQTYYGPYCPKCERARQNNDDREFERRGRR